MLEAVELPTGITDLDTGLANVNANDLPHFLPLFFFSSLSLSYLSSRSRLAFFHLLGGVRKEMESGKSGSVGMCFYLHEFTNDPPLR